MRRVRVVLTALAALAAGAAEARAQAWDTPAVRALVDRAAERRLANDSTLRAWTAEAEGTLRFLVDLGEGGVMGPRTVKVDQLATVLEWRQPGRTRQRIVGRRDTLLLPGDVGFYSDRYGVITNNLGDEVLLGDGRDVRGLPHPLSAAGRARYAFALVDSLGLQMPGRRVEVYELRLRPREEGAAAMVGSLYLDRATGDVVRLAVTFTRAAILDARIERLSLVLENLLVEGRYWLPHRQELEVVRKATWLDFPVRGVVRAAWRVCCHEAYVQESPREPAPFPEGGELVMVRPGNVVRLAPPEELARHAWPAPIVAALGEDEQLVSERETREVRRVAEGIVAARMLDRGEGTGLSGRRVSDFVRFNRVEGVALGLGGRLGLAPSWTLGAWARYGFADDAVKARAEVAWRARDGVTLLAYGERDYRDASDVAETSLARNSVSAALVGDDNTAPYEVQGGGVGARLDVGARDRLTVTLSRERHAPLDVNASPVTGRFGATLPARPLDATRLDAVLERRAAAGPFGGTWGWRLNGRLLAADPRDGGATSLVARLAVSGEVQWPAGPGTLVLGTAVAGVTGGSPPPQELVRFGGITTGPGYSFHQFVGRYGWSQRAEWRVGVPFVPVPIPFSPVSSSPRATLAPYAHVACVEGSGCRPSLGVAGIFLFDLLRVDVAYGLRDGGWRVGVDVARIFWGIL